MKQSTDSYWIRSAIFSFLQRFSVTFFGLINLIVLIRVLPKAEYGAWALFLTITSIFEMTKTALLKNAHIKFVSGHMQEKVEVASSSLLINLMVSTLFVILVLIFGPWTSRVFHTGSTLYRLLLWYIPAQFVMVFFAHLEAVQQSHLDFKGVFAGYFVRQAFFFVCIGGCYVLHLTYSLQNIVVFLSIGIVLGTGTLYWYSRPYLYHRFEPTKNWVRKILHYGKYIFGGGILSNIFTSLDQFMTGVLINAQAVATYNSALRLNSLLDIPSYAAADILFPKSAKASIDEGPERVRYLFEKMVGILMAFTAPITIFIILFPKIIILFVAGNRYLDAAPILQLYMLSGLVRPLQNQGANLLNSIGKPVMTFWMNAIALAINLSINYVLLETVGFYGAALGTSISSVISLVLWYYLMKKQIGFQWGTTFTYMIDTYTVVFKRAILILKTGKVMP